MAFSSTYEEENAYDSDVWRDRITASAQFLAYDEAQVVGTGTGFIDPTDPTTAHLVAMYVRPDFRRCGTGSRLVEAVVAQATIDQATLIRLWVVETNTTAERLYGRHGFVATGSAMRLPHNPNLIEHEMTLDLRSRTT